MSCEISLAVVISLMLGFFASYLVLSFLKT